MKITHKKEIIKVETKKGREIFSLQWGNALGFELGIFPFNFIAKLRHGEKAHDKDLIADSGIGVCWNRKHGTVIFFANRFACGYDGKKHDVHYGWWACDYYATGCGG